MDQRYRIECNSESVVLESSERLVFEPKGWQLNMRNDLRQALQGMRIKREDQLLLAALACHTTSGFDIESVLMYNVGASSLAHLTSRGFALERLTMTADLGQYPNRATYELETDAP